jgi:hypothetical protein
MTPDSEDVDQVHRQAELITLGAAHRHVAEKLANFESWHEERKRRSDRWTALLNERTALAERMIALGSEVEAAKLDLDEWDEQKP